MDSRIDNSDLIALATQAGDSARGDSASHRLPEKAPGMGFREGYKYTRLPDGSYLGYPAESKPEILKKKDGPMLLCEDGTVHFLTLWEQMALRAGFTNLERLNAKYKQQDYQGV